MQRRKDQSLASFFMLKFLAQPFRENIIGLDNGGFSGQFAIISFIFYVAYRCYGISKHYNTSQHSLKYIK